MRRRFAALLGGVVAALVVMLGLVPAGPASAHPNGKLSVNQLSALALYPDRIDVTEIVDAAELPTLQEKSTVDSSGDGVASPPELTAHAGRACGEFAAGFEVSVGADRLKWTVRSSAFEYVPGEAGLSTSRLRCEVSGPARLSSAATVRVANHYRTDRVGLREMTATGHGVRLVETPLPATSATGDLRMYPEDLLKSPPDVRSARLRVEPGDGSAGSGVAAGSAGAGGSGWLSGVLEAGQRRLTGIVAAHGQSPLIGVLAVLLALVLGAAHAALPGHGKTVMAAYLAGKRGRARDAVAVGAVVTLTHTGGVLVVGLLLTTAVGLAGQTVLGWLGVASGLLVTVVGAAMLIGLRRRGGGGHHHGHSHVHDHSHDHGHAHDHSHGHRHAHDHDHGRKPSRLGIAGIGIAGGLVPSPSALIVLLGAVGLGRTLFGVLLVLAYGLGMAGTLTAAGLLLVGLQQRWQRRRAARATGVTSPTGMTGRRGVAARVTARLSSLAPAATGSLVVLVGLGLLGRAAAGL